MFWKPQCCALLIYSLICHSFNSQDTKLEEGKYFPKSRAPVGVTTVLVTSRGYARAAIANLDSAERWEGYIKKFPMLPRL